MKRNILEYLEYNAEKMPDKTAVIDEKKKLTFGELLDRSKRIGSSLTEHVGSRDPVVVFGEKSADTLSAFLGIVQAGGYYVLVNPDFPDARIAQIQSVLQSECWITDKEHYSQALKFMDESKVFLMEEIQESPIDEAVLESRRQRMLDIDPLYANFTSGSTGVPKGVLVGHRSVVDFIDLFGDMFGITEDDVIGNQAPFDFDVSVKDIYTSLKMGATLVIVPKRLFSSPAMLLDFICEHEVTTMIWAVSALCLISTFHGLDYKVPKSVKHILFSGEEMPYKALREWMEHLPEAEFVNLYGPTEITCNCTYHRIERGRDYSEGIPIGQPFPNEDVFLLDEENCRITEPGKIGEICVRGSALALGYIRNPEQTRKVFTQNPLHAIYPERIYRTGDLGRFLPTGELLFGGRKDFQIKYMGHRIELEEIERAVASIEGVDRCCTVFDGERQKLYGFYLGKIDKKELRTKLKEILPIHMIPGKMMNIEEFPLTKNGKVDRKKLMEVRKR